MNKIYSLIWNRSRKQIEVASELARAHGGGGATDKASRTGMRSVQLALAIVLSTGLTPMALAGTNCSASSGTAHGTQATACGNGSTAGGTGSTAFGNTAKANGDDSTATGFNSTASADDTTATGAFASASMAGAVAEGSHASASGAYSTALGQAADTAGFANSVALGAQSVVDRANSVSVGSPSNLRQVTNVADGMQAHEAVNVEQLNAVAAASSDASRYFKANGANDDSDDASATGTHSVAAGSGATASAANTSAFGYDAHATGTNSVAIGPASKTTGDGAVAVGNGTAADIWGVAIGQNAQALTNTGGTGGASIAIGTNAYAKGDGSDAEGHNAAALAIGWGAQATADGAITLGEGGSATGYYATAVGQYSHATARNATVLGGQSLASQEGSLALGANSTASNVYAVALGFGSVTAAPNQTASAIINGTTYNFAGGAPTSVVSVGSVGNERQIINVAAGQLSSTSTDAINGSQLYATNQAVNAVGATASKGWNLAVNNGSLQHIAPGATVGVANGTNTTAEVVGSNLVFNVSESPAFTGSVTVGGILNANGGLAVASGQTVNMGGNVVTNVAAGSAPTDAVNVSQLSTAVNGAKTHYYSVSDGGTQGANYNNDGATGTHALAAGVGASAKGDHGTAVGSNTTASGDGSTAIGTGSTASGNASAALGSGAQATGDNSVAIGANSVAAGDNTVSVGSAGNERQITNVAAGTAPTDAVNVSQLQHSQQGGVQYDSNTDGSTSYDSVTLNPDGTGPTVIHNVATGAADNDAVNVSQLNQSIAGAVTTANNYTDQRYNELKGNLSQMGNRANAGIASAIAAASLPQPYAPNQSSLGVGVGTFHGEAGIAVGLSKISESGRYILKANVSSDTRGDFGAGVGAGIVW